MSDPRGLLRRNIVASCASQIYVTALGLIALPLYIKYLGAEGYGLVGFLSGFPVNGPRIDSNNQERNCEVQSGIFCCFHATLSNTERNLLRVPCRQSIKYAMEKLSGP